MRKDPLAGSNRSVSLETVERRILLLRGQKVMLDSDLAELYGVETKALNRAVKRNIERFPEDFMFQLTLKEAEILRCHFGTSNLRPQIATSRSRHGGRRYLPYAFIEQGVAMLSSVLNSEWAIQVNIAIMRAFVRLRRMLAAHKELARKLAELERRLANHDQKIQSVFEAIRQLMTPTGLPRRRIGFHAEARVAGPGPPPVKGMLAKVETMAVVGLTAQEVTAEVKGQRLAKWAIKIATTFRVDRKRMRDSLMDEE